MQDKTAKFYDQIASEYTQEHGYNEQLSLPALKKFLKLLPKNSSVLDVGCGGGQDSQFLTENGCSVFGIDISKEMIKLAKNFSSKAKFEVVDVLDLDSKIKKYGGIWCCRVFHHISIKDQVKFVKKLRNLLKVDGILYLTSVVSDKKRNYEIQDVEKGNIIKKRLTVKSFKELILGNNFSILEFGYWQGNKGMEIFAQKVNKK